MTAEITSGTAGGEYNGTVPAGQVGLWCSHGSSNSFDDFQVWDAVGPYLIYPGWYSSQGDVQVDGGNSNTLKTGGSYYRERTMVYDGFRGEKFVMTYRFKWNTSEGVNPGALVRYVDNGNWLAVYVATADGKARIRKRIDDGPPDNYVTSGTTLSLTNGNWYSAKVVIGDDLGNSALQRLRFWVDTDDDGDWSDETTLLDSTIVDDDWTAGKVGFFLPPGGNVAEFDDFKVGYDNNADLDIADGGDDIQADENFNTNAVTLAYDNNGNLGDDGIFLFVYDAWNRLVKATRRPDAKTAIATYAYDGFNRRTKKVVSNTGAELTAGDGGATTVHFYYSSGGSQPGHGGLPWNICETRNGSGQATRQWLWGVQYIDELVCMDVNGDPTESGDCDPDVTSMESTPDHRYFYHQDRNWNVVSLTEYTPPSGSPNYNGRVVERYQHTPYGSSSLLEAATDGSEQGSIRPLTAGLGSYIELDGPQSIRRTASRHALSAETNQQPSFSGDIDNPGAFTWFPFILNPPSGIPPITTTRFCTCTNTVVPCVNLAYAVELCESRCSPTQTVDGVTCYVQRCNCWIPILLMGWIEENTRAHCGPCISRNRRCNVVCQWEPISGNVDVRCSGIHAYVGTGQTQGVCKASGQSQCNSDIAAHGLRCCRCKHCAFRGWRN